MADDKISTTIDKDLKIWRPLNFYKRVENHKEAVKDGTENIMRVGY
jgi:hypothetical protein